MRRCPVCQRTYPNDAQNFCLEDGTTLVSMESANPYDKRSAPTEVMYPATPTAQPATPFTSFATPKKSRLHWILGGVGALVVAIIVIVVIANSGSNKSSTSSKVNVNIDSPTSSSTSSSSTTSSSSWQALNGDKFNASMPGRPAKTENSQPTAVGSVPITMYSLDTGSEGYVVGYSEYPSYVFSSKDTDTLLDGARDGAVKNVNGEVLSERPISIGSYVGREITGKSSSQGFAFTARLYLANPRMYMLIFLRKGDEPISDDGRKFLDSFEITGD